ncbi:alpha-L-fucosidase [Microbacterium sp. NPDC077184]|uniref:alpha-L-fucosidase n=1 Tax=Microbacterium sp. NPDC077184 TaxID=3154764 RepID=UPI0034364A19
MKRSRRRPALVAAACALALSGSVVTAAPVAAEPLAEGLLAHYEFDQTTGTAVADVSGNAQAATVAGEPEWTGASLRLSGVGDNGNIVRLPDGLLAGRTAATVSVEVKATASTLARDNFLWNVGGTSTGSAGTGSWFVAPRANLRTAITPTNWSGEQSAGWGRTLTPNAWHNVTATIQEQVNGTSTMRLFVDGAEVAMRQNVTTGLGDLTDHMNTVLGGAAYADSLGFAGEFAEARVYERALDASEVAELSDIDAQSTSASLTSSLDLGDTSAVTGHIVLPAFATWSSSDEGVVSSTGRVIRPAVGESPETVTLAASVDVRGSVTEREFEVTVLPQAEGDEPEGPYEASWESLAAHDASPEWFRDAKFGVYWHWGAFTTPQHGSEWYGRYVYGQHPVRDFHTRTYGAPEVWGYENFIDGAPNLAGDMVQFDPVLASEGGDFDPSAWLDAVEASGARFAGPVAEHHDGFSMWDSEVNEWNSVDRGPQLDLLKIFADEVRERDLKLVVAMHQAFNTNGFFKDAPRQTDPSLQKLYGQLPKEESDQLWFDKQREVIDHVQPDIIWNDFGLDSPGWCVGGSDICAIDEEQRLKFLAYYFNRAEEWGTEVVTTYKHFDSGFRDDSAVADWERGGPADISRPYWLTDDAISASSWSYTDGIGYYSSKQMVHSLIDRVSKNGNMLLNISPTAAGVLPAQQEAVLRAIGEYLDRYGESIYDTRAWDVYGEGPNTAGGGSFTAPLSGDGRDIRFTRDKSESTLYATMLGWPGETVSIASLGADTVDLAGLESIELIGAGDGDEVISLTDYAQDSEALTVELPARPAESLAYVLKLRFADHIPTPQLVTGVSVFSSTDATGNGAAVGEGAFDAVYLDEAGVSASEIRSLRVSPDTTVRVYGSADLTGESRSFGPGVHAVTAGSVGSISTAVDRSGAHVITSVVNGFALDVEGEPVAGARVSQRPVADGESGQIFELRQAAETSDGVFYQVIHRDSGLAIDGMGRGSGTFVELQTPADVLSQQFRLVAGAEGGYTLVNRAVDLALDSGGVVPSGSFLKQWNRDGSPNLSFRLLRVEEPAPEFDVDVTASTRCLAGKVLLAVTVRNTGDSPYGVEIRTSFGKKTVTSLAPDKATSVAFTTRAASASGGDVDVTVRGILDGQERESEVSVPFAPHSCG